MIPENLLFTKFQIVEMLLSVYTYCLAHMHTQMHTVHLYKLVFTTSNVLAFEVININLYKCTVCICVCMCTIFNPELQVYMFYLYSP